MHRGVLFVSILVWASSLFVVGALAGACTSTAAAPVPEADGAPIGNALGTSCDPSLPNPCEALTDVCSVAICDPSSRVCSRVAVDAGPTCSGGSATPPACGAGADCDAGADADVAAEAGTTDAGDASDGGSSGVDAADGAADAGSPDGGADATPDALAEAGDDDGGGD